MGPDSSNGRPASATVAGPPATFSLRPLRTADAPDVLAAFRSAPDMDRQGTVTDAATACAYVEQWCAGEDRRAFALTDDDRLVALVGLTVDMPNRLGWFSYWLHASHRGRGLAACAAATVANWALAAGGLERLELGHRANNPASGAVARAAGFVMEGLERQKFLVDGTRVDVLTYGRLRTDPQPPTPTLLLADTGGALLHE